MSATREELVADDPARRLPLQDDIKRPSKPARFGAGRAAWLADSTRTVRATPWFWFALPSFILIITFFVLPFLLNAVLAFTQWTGFSSKIYFNGLENFSALVRQNVLLPAVRATLIYAVVIMVAQNAISLSLALLMQQTNAMNSFFRSVYFLPVLISPVAAGYIWAAIVHPVGPLNQAISAITFSRFDFPWLGNAHSAIIMVSLIDAWKWSGFFTLIYIAGLNGIPKELLDAARIDGASAWKRFWQIQFPLLAPALTFNVVVTLVGAFGAYDVILATTTGGPGNATTVLNIALWKQWSTGMFGTASALGFTVTIMVVVTAIPLVWWLRRREVTL